MRKIILDPPAKEVGSKNRNPKDLVTSCDIQIQEILRQKLTALLPEASFLGEEGSTDYRRDGYCFVCDPIDGTVNFVKNYRWSCVSVALLKDGRPQTGVVFNPFADELFTAEKAKALSSTDVRSALPPIRSIFRWPRSAPALMI